MVYKLKNTGIGITPEATLLFFIAHIFVAFFIRASETFSTIYALAIFITGVLVTLTRRSVLVASIIGYIAGAEVLLRMTHADVFWEYGKYAVSGILILALLTRAERKRWPVYVVLYFLLLLPAISLTPYTSWTQWRMAVSFNMSGPLSLCLCGLYFSGLTFDKKDFRRIITWLIAPIVSIAFLIVLGIAQQVTISWAAHSLFTTSGEYGPNQVSSILGLGAFFAVAYCALAAKEARIFRIIFISVAVWFFIHAVLTFSRGGVLGASIPFLVFFVSLIKSKRNRFATLFLGIFLISLNYYYLIPKLNSYTHGALSARYGRREQIGAIKIMDTTKRLDIARSDLEAFENNLILGVGIGNSRTVHYQTMGAHAEAHTEWTRILAEHGLLGAGSIIFLFIWILKRYRSMKEPTSRALALSFIVALILYMGHSAMRLVIPSLMVGFLSVNLKLTEQG